jgi:hypothetical protein
MINKGSQIKNSKLRGEWAELRFLTRAVEHGLMVSRPWGDSAPYDLMVEHNGRVLRVQVKSTMYGVNGGYLCKLPHDRSRTARVRRVEFVAVYIIPEDVWYILPAHVAAGLRGNIWLTPHRRGHKYERYLEAWHLLLGRNRARR